MQAAYQMDDFQMFSSKRFLFTLLISFGAQNMLILMRSKKKKKSKKADPKPEEKINGRLEKRHNSI